MSKENRRKSKVNKVLKAAGTAGVVFGAASIDANVVFAAELEEGMETQQTEAAAVAQAELQDTAASQAVYQAPVESQAPVVEQAPAESQAPVVEQAPAESQAPVVEQAPAESQAPAEVVESASSQVEAVENTESQSTAESVESTSDLQSEVQNQDIKDAEDENEADGSGSLGSESDSDAGSDSGSESVSQQTWSDVESTSVVNSDSAVSDSNSFNSVSESASLSASNSDSLAHSASESHLQSTSVSHSTVLSESTSSSLAISESLSEFNSVSENHSIGSLTSEMASALSTYDSALSTLHSTSEGGTADLDRLQKATAESIIMYNIASQGLTLNTDKGGIVWNESGKYYTVHYKDGKGRELTQTYQYTVDEQGNVSVNVVNISYGATGGTQVNTDISGSEFIQSGGKGTETSVEAGQAPTIKYEVETLGNGKTKVVITINGREYVDPDRQINPDGTISYILEDTPTERKLFVINADGTGGYYKTYRKTNSVFNNENNADKNSATIDRYKVNGMSYDVAGGNSTNGKYAVVQDENGGWHKLIIKGTNRQIVIRNTLLSNAFYWQADGKGGYNKIGSDYTLKTDANGNFGLYDKHGNLIYELEINTTVDYTPKTTTTTYTYDREIKKDGLVEGHSEVLSEYYSEIDSR